MFNVDVLNDTDHINDSEIIKVVDFCEHQLQMEDISDDIDVVIDIFPTIEMASVISVSDYPDLPRDFYMTLDSGCNEEDALQSIIHEFVHIKQYARGELSHMLGIKFVAKDTNLVVEGLSVKWMGENITCAYSDAPWERQADFLTDLIWDNYKNDKTCT